MKCSTECKRIHDFFNLHDNDCINRGGPIIDYERTPHSIQWISVRDKLPPIGPVLIYLSWCHEIRIAHIDCKDGEVRWKDDNNYTYDLIDHDLYHPLPDKPCSIEQTTKKLIEQYRPVLEKLSKE